MGDEELTSDCDQEPVSDLSDAMLREVYRAGEDPEITRFLATLDRPGSAARAISPGAWREIADPPEADRGIGRVEGHILLEVLAEGGMAVVFLAEESALERIVALKMLSPRLSGDDEARERFLREAKAAAGLVHENILPVYRVGESPLPFFTMQHVGGGSLQDRIDQGVSFSEEQWFALARQVGGALRTAHAAGIVHRDIKPSNLLYDQAERLWVADFGIAASMHAPLLAADRVIGTPRYMSPEQARGETLDGRSDLFSLGAVLYRVAAGRDLVTGNDSREVFHELENADFREPLRSDPRLTPAQATLLRGMLAGSPEERFVDADQMLEAIEPGQVRHPTGSGRKGRWLIPAVAALTFLLAAVSLVIVRDRADPIPAKAAVPAPALPEIRIEGKEGVFRDFESAFAAAHDGAALLLDGVFVCRKTCFGPEGLSLSIRPAPGAHAVVIASLPEEHALFFRGPTEVRDITFVRESGTASVVPIVGFHTGNATVRRCRFETVMPEAFLLGPSLSFTSLERAVVERCVFRTRGRDAIGFGFMEGSPSMRVTVRDSIVLGGVAMCRRVWGPPADLTVEWERSVVVADTFFLEHPRNQAGELFPIGFRVTDCVLDLDKGTVGLGNGVSPTVAELRIPWSGDRNRHRQPFLRIHSFSFEPSADAIFVDRPITRELEIPFSGSERSPSIQPYVDRETAPVTLDELIEIIRRDPERVDLLRDLPH